MKIAVKKGAEWLDTVRKDWWKSVNLKDIDLELFEGCVIGQVFSPDVSKALCSQGSFSLRHGFRLKIGEESARSSYLKLSSVWAQEIEQRKKK